MASALASYAIEQLLLSVLMLLIGAVVLRWVPAYARHPWLLGALLVAVLGPLLPFAVVAPDDAGRHLLEAGAPGGSAVGFGFPAGWAAALLGLWGAVGLFRLYRLICAWRNAHVLAQLSPRSPGIEQRHADLLPPGTRVHLSAGFGPAVLGVWTPCIVLPGRLAGQLPREALRAVLAHEAEHIARRDPAWHALQCVVLAVFWWNPALAHLARWLDQARELACDAGAVHRTGDRVQYADTLLCVAADPQHGLAPPRLAGLAMAGSAPLLERRIDAVLESRRHGRGARSGMAAGGLALTMACAWAAASTAAPAVSVQAWEQTPDPERFEHTAAEAEWQPRWQSANDGHQLRSQSAQAEYERLSQAAQAGYERLSQTAQSGYEQLSQTAQSGYEQLSQTAQSEQERLSQVALMDHELRLASADHGRRQTQDPSP